MKTIYLLLVLVFLMILTACKKDKDPRPPNLPYVVAGNSANLFSPDTEPYHIVIPESLISGSKDIDINNDGIMDYHLRITCPFQNHSLESWIGIESYDDNEVATTYSNPTWIKSFHANDTIDAGETWYACNVILYQAPGNAGYWNNVTDRYVGVRTHVKGKVLYGWISIDVVKPDQLVLNGFGSQW